MPKSNIANSASSNDIRRSGRKRTSTIMVIQGQAVKKENNYVLKGDTYHYGAHEGDVLVPKKKSKHSNASTTPSRSKRISSHERARMNQNNAVKKRIAKDVGARSRFMADNINILKPFLEEKVRLDLTKKALKNSTKECPAQMRAKNFTLMAQPDIVTTTLRDYQSIGLQWMIKMCFRGINMILGDEMGLGKTLQTIALIAYHKESQTTSIGPSLVVCPLSVLYSWCDEVKKHAPSLRIFRLHSSDKEEKLMQKKNFLENFLEYDMIITTYDMVKSSEIQSLIRGVYFHICVLDEGHIIKNRETKISEGVRKIHSQHKLILTGTPLQNNLEELYAILNYLYPDIFTKSDSFANAFDITKNCIDPDMLLKANKMLGLFMLRRLKEEVEKMMPKKIETKILCPLSSSQIFWYKGFLMDEIDTLIQLSESTEIATTKAHDRLRNLVMQFRKVCNHPYMFDFIEGDVDSTEIEELIATSGKLSVLDKVLRSLFQKGSRVVIFSQFTTMLDILDDYCSLRGWNFCRFDGSTPRAQRNHLINQFNADGSDDFIFLMSTRSGGLGINLQTADTCILYDSDWNPQPDLQAMARVHRIGQKKTVHVYRLVSHGTVEDRILERATKKLYLDQVVNRGGSSENIDENLGLGLSTKELLDSLKFGSNAIFQSSNDLPTDNDIDKLTDRNRSEMTSFGILKGGITSSAKDYDKDKKLTDTMTFAGVDFRELRRQKEEEVKKKEKKEKYLYKLKQEWKEVGNRDILDLEEKRLRKSRIKHMSGENSGYGTKYVPVLAMNDYNLEDGEPSVWRETSRPQQTPMRRKKTKFLNQDFCQTCGGGGKLIECPRCPVSVHEYCCRIKAKHFQCCSHHNCMTCGKAVTAAGGLLYPCQSCPSTFCGDCLPKKNVRFLGSSISRFEKLGFEPRDSYHYIHCSEQCELVATIEFGFKKHENIATCPKPINVSYAFGSNALSAKDIVRRFSSRNPLNVTNDAARPIQNNGETRVPDCMINEAIIIDD